MHLQCPSKNEYSPAIFNWYGILEKFGYKVFYHEYNNFKFDELYNLVKTNKPDFIFHPTYNHLHTEFIKLKEFSKLYVIHSDDDWRFDDYTKYWIPFTDGAIGYQNQPESYLKYTQDKNYYYRARWAFNPNTMYFKFDPIEPIYKISHVGKLHGKKNLTIENLESLGLIIDKIDPNFDSYQLYMECFHKSIISLCLTNNVLGTAKQSKTRLSEMPFYCILASEPWPKMEMWNLEPNKDFILIDNDKNFVYIIEKVIKDKEFREKMYKSGKEILINNNTVYHEWNNIMNQFDPDFKKFDINKILKENHGYLYER